MICAESSGQRDGKHRRSINAGIETRGAAGTAEEQNWNLDEVRKKD